MQLLSQWSHIQESIQNINEEDLLTLYSIFKFYDSSLSGDRLPSINYTTYIKLLKDCKVLDDSFSPQMADQIYAQSVSSKLRAFLDADDCPTLTFNMFCGAIISIAKMKNPLLSASKSVSHLLLPLNDLFLQEKNANLEMRSSLLLPQQDKAKSHVNKTRLSSVGEQFWFASYLPVLLEKNSSERPWTSSMDSCLNKAISFSLETKEKEIDQVLIISNPPQEETREYIEKIVIEEFNLLSCVQSRNWLTLDETATLLNKLSKSHKSLDKERIKVKIKEKIQLNRFYLEDVLSFVLYSHQIVEEKEEIKRKISVTAQLKLHALSIQEEDINPWKKDVEIPSWKNEEEQELFCILTGSKSNEGISSWTIKLKGCDTIEIVKSSTTGKEKIQKNNHKSYKVAYDYALNRIFSQKHKYKNIQETFNLKQENFRKRSSIVKKLNLSSQLENKINKSHQDQEEQIMKTSASLPCVFAPGIRERNRRKLPLNYHQTFNIS